MLQEPLPPEGPSPRSTSWTARSQQMVRLVEDLLDVSRITRNELALHRERVTLQDVILDALELSRPLIHERGHASHVRRHRG